MADFLGGARTVVEGMLLYRFVEDAQLVFQCADQRCVGRYVSCRYKQARHCCDRVVPITLNGVWPNRVVDVTIFGLFAFHGSACHGKRVACEKRLKRFGPASHIG
ncbi:MULTISPECIES: hypothetical protein [Rhizobium]|uniref:Uncharacterized protein n=1 Tax=Rhizobium aouanii TaxID=3118145 RepID=A0ABU8CL37_9HYPH|nr:hypothetical protein [Rhizobium acaciae]MCW1410837.1 hypothetical protein [Rhizobium acaciae]MCW1742864.1 hypothetical protein [Rhizobium acaciae]MCW1750060.1 hypothetical protein [Rhizobium acaciae]